MPVIIADVPFASGRGEDDKPVPSESLGETRLPLEQKEQPCSL